jgi:hypothetical protein
MNPYAGNGIVIFTGIIFTGSAGAGTLTVEALGLSGSQAQIRAKSYLEVIRIA